MKRVNAPRRLAVDTVTYFTPYERYFWNMGCRTVFRYLNYHKYYRETPCTNPNDWFKSASAQELQELTDIGWRVGLVQRGIGKRNRGEPGTGAEAGEAAVYNANGIGVPDGVTIFCDCEWAASHNPDKATQMNYIEDWASRVVYGEKGGGQYVSPDLKMNSAELYSLKKITAYWKSASIVPTVDTRGYQALQSLEYFYHIKRKWILPFRKEGALVPWDNVHYKHKGIRCDTNMICVDGKRSYLSVVGK